MTTLEFALRQRTRLKEKKLELENQEKKKAVTAELLRAIDVDLDKLAKVIDSERSALAAARRVRA